MEPERYTHDDDYVSDTEGSNLASELRNYTSLERGADKEEREFSRHDAELGAGSHNEL